MYAVFLCVTKQTLYEPPFLFGWRICAYFPVPRKVLKEKFEEGPAEDEEENVDDFDDYNTDDFIGESAAYSPSPNLDVKEDFTKMSPKTTPRPGKGKNSSGGKF